MPTKMPKPGSGVKLLQVRVPEQMFADMRALGKAHSRSLRGEVEWALLNYLAREAKAHPALRLSSAQSESICA